MRATRDASGWKVEEPTPIRPEAINRVGKVETMDSISTPARVKHMPMGSRNGSGRRSVYKPIQGCSNEAVHWNVRVMRPTWVKLSENSAFSIGYIDGNKAWIRSFCK